MPPHPPKAEEAERRFLAGEAPMEAYVAQLLRDACLKRVDERWNRILKERPFAPEERKASTMKRTILLSSIYREQYDLLQEVGHGLVNEALMALSSDPLTKRDGCTIKPLRLTDPAKHLLKAGDFRVIYHVGDECVSVIEVYEKKHGFRCRCRQ